MSNPTTTMCVDLKQFRIRIYKTTLHSLGDPKYIQILVNPNDKAVAIRSVDVEMSGDQTFRINFQQLTRYSYVINSRTFTEKLCEIDETLEPNGSYRLSGYILPDKRIAIFPLSTICKIEIKESVNEQPFTPNFDNR